MCDFEEDCLRELVSTGSEFVQLWSEWMGRYRDKEEICSFRSLALKLSLIKSSANSQG